MKLTEAQIAITEKQFRQNVIDLAKVLGYDYYFSWTSIHSPRGWPDLSLAREGQPIIFIELKVGKNKPTELQKHWIELLNTTGNKAFVFWPYQWDEIVEVLNGDNA